MDLKIIYHNLRIGQVTIFPLLSMINLIIITYSLTDITKHLPFHVYAPLLVIVLVMAFIIIGKFFKGRQLSTDQNEIFRKQTELIKTLRLILESQELTRKNEAWIRVLKKYESD